MKPNQTHDQIEAATDDIQFLANTVNCDIVNEILCILIEISLKFVGKYTTNNKPTLVC